MCIRDRPAAGGEVAGHVLQAPLPDPFAALGIVGHLLPLRNARTQDRFFRVQDEVVHRDAVGGQ